MLSKFKSKYILISHFFRFFEEAGLIFLMANPYPCEVKVGLITQKSHSLLHHINPHFEVYVSYFYFIETLFKYGVYEHC